MFKQGDVVQHVKTRGFYVIIRCANYEEDSLPCYVYELFQGNTGKTWVRAKAVMEDGRFVFIKGMVESA
jgi:hypothetical protein